MKRLCLCLCLLIAYGAALVVAPASAGQAEDDPRVTPVVEAYRKARVAVVSISTEKVVNVRWGLFGGADPFADIFPSPLRRRRQVHTIGSGFVIHPDGYIVTNAHVVRQADKITVALADQSTHSAKLISSDRGLDLAVLRIDPPGRTKLAFLPLGRSDDLMVGETVIAIGNPLGYANSLTTGVISAVNRTLDFRGGVKVRDLIQTDAPINPGNSGGPLLNIKGELIGINTAIRADAQNIGFAIPIDRLADELTQLLDFESLNRVIFGARIAHHRNAEGRSELRVTKVRKNTPADGKLRVGDRILAVNGKPMPHISDYACEMVQLRPDETLHLKLLRDGKELTVEVALKPKPRPDGAALARKLFGITLRPVTKQLSEDLHLPVDRGLLVVGVDADSPADALGIQLKDVIFQMHRFPVTDLDALGIILEEVKGGQKVQIGIVRGNVRAWATIAARPHRK